MVSIVSVTIVTRRSWYRPPGFRSRRLLAVAIEAVTMLPSAVHVRRRARYTLTLPLLRPAAMAIVAPLLRVTVTADCGGRLSDAV